MQIRSVGIDLGKTTFHLVALGAAAKVLLRKKFTQKQLITFTANMQTSLIGMELVQALTSSDVYCESRAITSEHHLAFLKTMRCRNSIVHRTR
jgi:hypothetical protein